MASIARSALGIADHTGWAIAVAVTGDPAHPEVIDRRRVVLLDADVPPQPYHAARGLPLRDAEELVARVEQSAAASARRALHELLADLATHARCRAIAIRGEGRPLPAGVEAILASHAAMHAAEGVLYRDALRGAADDLGIGVVGYERGQGADTAALMLGTTAAVIKDHLERLRGELGPPWREDHRTACLAAAVALAGST